MLEVLKVDPYQSRTEAFGEGVVGSPYLQRGEQEYNASVPSSFEPSSPLHQLIRSANGLSDQDADRRLLGPGDPLLPTGNASSKSTYEAKRPFLSSTLNL